MNNRNTLHSRRSKIDNPLSDRRVLEEFVDNVHVTEKHTAAAVPLVTQSVERVSRIVPLLEKGDVIVPPISYHLLAREASYG